MAKQTVRDLDVKGKRVLVRVDFNVPIKDGKITNDNRIVSALPTINYLTEHGAKVILMSHLGKIDHKDPEKCEAGKKKNNMAPVAARLQELVSGKVTFVPVTRGEELEKIGLRVPQITKIMQELRSLGCPVDGATLTVDDALHQLIPFFKRKEELR